LHNDYLAINISPGSLGAWCITHAAGGRWHVVLAPCFLSVHVFGLRRTDEKEGRRANKLEDFLELTLSIRTGKSLSSSPGFLSAAQPLNYGII
jgi:hypothetical protein